MASSTSTRRIETLGLAPVEPSDNVLVAYAARDGTVAKDGAGRNSPYTQSLLRHIETAGLEIDFLFRHVRDDVIAATDNEQQPFVYAAGRPRGRTKVADALQPTTSPRTREKRIDYRLWRSGFGQYPRYGYRRIRIFLGRDGHRINVGRAYRLW
jgi:hypothetical protein